MLGFIIGGPTDNLHLFTRRSETGLGESIDSTALLSGKRQTSVCGYDSTPLIQPIFFSDRRLHAV